MISLRSKVTQSVLSYFFINENASVYVNELARILCLNPGNLDRKLKELEKEGLLTSEFMGKQRYYKLNNDSGLLSVYRDLAEKTFGFESVLFKSLKAVPGIVSVYLFGSYVSGTMDEHSDIDLLIVGDASMKEVQQKIRACSQKIDRNINPVYMSEEEFAERQQNKDPFICSVLEASHRKII